jgi:two-component system, cell cycle response regulator
MARLIGGIGLAVPPALAALYVVMPDWVAAWTGSPGALSLAAAVAGATFVVSLTVLVVLGWVRFRLRRLVAAIERLAEGDTDLDLPAGHGFDRRMIEAINGVSRALSTTQHAATVDKLTGIANRQALLADLFTEVERATRYQRPLSVAFVDIDHFKTINDTYGHEVGDVVLRAVAQTLKANIRSTDMVGRYGGEEFMLLLRETSVEDGAALAEKLRLLVQRLSFNVAGNPNLNVTISIGLAGGEGRQIRVDTLIRDADAAMYSAKSLGRNQTYIFEEPDEDSRVPRAPISASGRARAIQVGKTARDAAAAALASVLAPLPHYRGQPSALIASIVENLARHLELSEAEIERLRIAALLHDLGKVAVPQEILDKPAALTSAEWRTVVQHPRVGQVILEQASMLKEAIPIILHHHERYAGHGYPYGLRGTDIPLGARIVAVADAYDAMTHDRPYKRAISHEEAIRELRRHAGTQFDPELVALFCDLYAHAAPEPDAAVLAMTAVDDAHVTGPGRVIVPREKPRRRSRSTALG